MDDTYVRTHVKVTLIWPWGVYPVSPFCRHVRTYVEVLLSWSITWKYNSYKAERTYDQMPYGLLPIPHPFEGNEKWKNDFNWIVHMSVCPFFLVSATVACVLVCMNEYVNLSIDLCCVLLCVVVLFEWVELSILLFATVPFTVGNVHTSLYGFSNFYLSAFLTVRFHFRFQFSFHFHLLLHCIYNTMKPFYFISLYR